MSMANQVFENTEKYKRKKLSVLRPPSHKGSSTLLRHSPNGVFLSDFARGALDWAVTCDAALCVTHISDGYTAMTGIPVRQSVTQPLEDLLHFSSVEEAALFMARLSNGEAFHKEPIVVKAEAGTVPATLSAVPLNDADGALIGIEGGINALAEDPVNDNTAKNTDEQLRFAHQVQHELRTPLNAIAGFAQIMREDLQNQADGRYASYCDDILSASSHLLGLIDDMVSAYGASETGPAMVPTEIGLATLFTEVERLLLPVAEKAGVALVIHPPVPDVMCITDRRKLKQILVNLLENAIKFTPEGACAGIRMGDAEPHKISIIVWDDGRGIPLADQQRIWNRFEKSGRQSEYEAGSPGLGLGLSVVKALADGLGAQLLLESEEDQGTRFTISLPTVS